MEEYLKWFEDVCQQLGREPVVATKALQNFATTPEAFDVSKHLLGKLLHDTHTLSLLY
jgi:hypothetical protein